MQLVRVHQGQGRVMTKKVNEAVARLEKRADRLLPAVDNEILVFADDLRLILDDRKACRELLERMGNERINTPAYEDYAKECRELEEKATPGPWEIDETDIILGAGEEYAVPVGVGPFCEVRHESGTVDQAWRDARLASHNREAATVWREMVEDLGRGLACPVCFLGQTVMKTVLQEAFARAIAKVRRDSDANF